jgi:hypothetical protein
MVIENTEKVTEKSKKTVRLVTDHFFQRENQKEPKRPTTIVPTAAGKRWAMSTWFISQLGQ